MIPVIDFETESVEFIPNNRRIKKFKALFKALFSQPKRQNNIFEAYTSGTSGFFWDNTVTYNTGDEVIWNRKIWKSLVDNNVGTGEPQTLPSDWLLISDFQFGTSLRSKISSSRIALEWAINNYFSFELFESSVVPPFIQPDDPINPTRNCIYIDTIVPIHPTFLIGATEASSDSISIDGSTGFITQQEVFTTASSYMFSVNIPTVIYSNIDINPSIADSIIKKFLDKYIPAGIGYIINIY